MRPVRLTLQAFGPYPERVVIDFRDAVEAGLFGIYGQTGSGKSTIFSAMTFALFGEPAKSEQEAPSLRSDHADPGVPTEVEFVFDVGSQRFVILRRPDQIRPKTRGDGDTRSAHEAYLFDATGMSPDEITDAQRGKIIAEKKVREVDTAITRMLGYGSEQFRQIVLLPQGRFEKFLAVKTKERLEILRELFDVSRYEALMADLKSEAEAAERHVREERALCARQLSAEGFESTDALIVGIEAAKARFNELLATEEDAKAKTQAAEMGLRQAEAIEEKFEVAKKAQGLLAELRKQTEEIEALAEQVQQAERARAMLDAEQLVTDTGREVGDAQTTLREAREVAERATEEAVAAAEALKREEERSAEADELRRSRDELKRFGQVLEAAAGSDEAVETALKAQRRASDAFATAQARLTGLRETHTKKGEILKAARGVEARRADIVGRRAASAAKHAVAEAYEKAQRDVQAASVDVEQQAHISEAASQRAESAHKQFEAAEQALAAAQALHLATRLEAGSPCPVCGATEHPSPATGEIENAGLDKAFRDARDAWRKADLAFRQATEKLAGLQATLTDRKKRLSGLNQPVETAEALAAKIASEEAALEALGPVVDIAAADVEIEGLEGEISTLERERDELRDRFEECRNKATEATTTRDGKLAEVPVELRDPEALAAALEKVSRSLDDLVVAKAAAEQAVRTTRETALGATKDRESAERGLAACQERHQKAGEAFQKRLIDAGLTEEVFQALKPAIETLDTDRETVEDHRRKLQSAQDAARAADLVVEGMTRPDLQTLGEAHRVAAEVSGRATEERVGAKNRVDHLTRLRTGLEDTMRRLDEAEAASGPLRGLAALVNGQNPQRLTLETFAIGAMFDQVLEAANLRLGPMTSGRYRLERDLDGAGRGSRGLGIQVFDMHTGKSRATSTLSGGETFIAALALALGLADVVESANGKVRLDTIFIDEGFGSLDTENGAGTLDQVLQVLSSLVSQNRAVGLISHVPLVQEAIPNGFYVRKDLAGSRVEVRGLV